MAQNLGISQGEKGGVRAWDRPVGMQMGAAAPQATLNERPNAWGTQCPQPRHRATSPALPSVLYQCG